MSCLCIFFRTSSSEAGEGFNACKVCGFENFKRFPFCNVCGDKILEHESAQQLSKKKKKTLAWGSKKSSKKSEYEGVSAKISASIPVEPTQRQQRARFVRPLLFALALPVESLLIARSICYDPHHNITGNAKSGRERSARTARFSGTAMAARGPTCASLAVCYYSKRVAAAAPVPWH